MAFVNEYISDEDREKYNIDDLYIRENSRLIRKGLSDNHKLNWTIDRERGLYLMKVRVGREELSNRSIWILNWQGQEIKIKIDRADGGSLTYSDLPYIVIWNLVDIELVNVTDITNKKVIEVLKEALIEYGVNVYVDNAVVKFNF